MCICERIRLWGGGSRLSRVAIVARAATVRCEKAQSEKATKDVSS